MDEKLCYSKSLPTTASMLQCNVCEHYRIAECISIGREVNSFPLVEKHFSKYTKPSYFFTHFDCLKQGPCYSQAILYILLSFTYSHNTCRPRLDFLFVSPHFNVQKKTNYCVPNLLTRQMQKKKINLFKDETAEKFDYRPEHIFT
jgi:hypothetical protein